MKTMFSYDFMFCYRQLSFKVLCNVTAKVRYEKLNAMNTIDLLNNFGIFNCTIYCWLPAMLVCSTLSISIDHLFFKNCLFLLCIKNMLHSLSYRFVSHVQHCQFYIAPSIIVIVILFALLPNCIMHLVELHCEYFIACKMIHCSFHPI